MLNRLSEFVLRVNGKSYGFNLKKLFPKKHRTSSKLKAGSSSSSSSSSSGGSGLGSEKRGNGGDSAATSPIAKDEKKDAFFCSELVAEGLREMGVIQVRVWAGNRG